MLLTVSTANITSTTWLTIPSVLVNDEISGITFPSINWLTDFIANEIVSIPNSSRVFISFDWLNPSWFKSCHILSFKNWVSLRLIFPSLLSSNLARAINPVVVLLPNNSLILSIVPLSLLSSANKPSLAATHPVLIRIPLLLRSKCTREFSRLIKSIPLPFKSKTRGSILTVAAFCAWL